ncbi:glycine-rich protein 2-like protein [Tanacetum coccineum]
MLVKGRRYFGTVADFSIEKDCGHINPADDGEDTVFFWGIVVEGDQAATIYDGASVEFSVTREGAGWAHAVRSCRSGTVVYVNDIRGFGFIRPADGGEDIRFHRTNAMNRLGINEIVEFLVNEDPQVMPQALEVRLHDDI